MRTEEWTVRTFDNLRLFARSWLPAQPATPPRADIVLVHGAWEHSERYEHVARHLAAAGYAVHTFDLHGHGKSEGKRAYVRSVDDYLDDLEHFLAAMRRRKHNDAPLFLMGHSLGGGIVTLYTIERAQAMQGLILSGPLLKLPDMVPAFLHRITLGLAHIAPWLPVFKVRPGDISRDPDVVKQYKNDPLVHTGWVSAAMMAVIVRIPTRIRPKVEALSHPLLIMHGTADRLTHPEGSKQLYEYAGAADKTLNLYDGLYHEIMNEPEQEQVFNDIITWLHARTEEH